MTCKRCKKQIPDNSKFCPHCGRKQVVERRKRARGNGEGSVYSEGGKYTAEITVGWDQETHKRIIKKKRGFIKKSDAIDYISELRKQANGEMEENPIDENTAATLSDFYEPWKATWSKRNLSKSKQVAYQIAYGKLKPIADKDISKITIEDLQNIIDEKAPTYYPAKDMKTVLTKCYKRACAQTIVQVNIAEYIVLPILEEKEADPFTEAELKALWSAYANGDHFIGYILVMTYSGMMPGELLICKKNMIDWNAQTITGCGLKTKKRKQTPIVIADIIVPVLRRVCMISRTEYLVDMTRNDFYSEFHAALQRASCSDHTPYTCRHTTATALAIGTDVAPSIIQKVMRHARFTTTQRYIHPDAKDALAAVNKLGAGGYQKSGEAENGENGVVVVK